LWDNKKLITISVSFTWALKVTFRNGLIEPDLYFDYAPDAKRRYIEAIEFVVGGGESFVDTPQYFW
jgi:hypothetical protein